MRFLVIFCALVIAGRSAHADARQDTETALAAERKATQEVTAAAAARAELDSRYQSELRTIDRLKKQRGSWRRDRQLRESLASSLETAKKLEAASTLAQRAGQAQQAARKRAAAAVTAELRTAADTARVATLQREHARLSPGAAPSKKIVIPELEIDPLADPEELEQQALAIRQSETALAQQVAVLEERGKRLDEQAELRRQHDRAEDLVDRDDSRTRRGGVVSRANGEAAGDAAAGGAGTGSPPPSSDPGPTPTPTSVPLSSIARDSENVRLLAESSTVLGEVIDATTLEALRKAQTSTDPAVRAAAAKLARDAAAAKLTTLRKQRALIEARVRALRNPARR